MNIKFLILFLSSFLFLENTLAQEPEISASKFQIDKQGFKKAWNSVRSGDKFYGKQTKGGLLSALDYYLEAYSYNSNNSALNYKIGICYLRTINKSEALIYLQKAYTKDPKISFDVLYALATARQYSYQFEASIADYQLFISSVSGSIASKYRKRVAKRIAECKVGIELLKNPVNVVFKNISSINSDLLDYRPLIMADESMMFFTSRRENTTGGRRDKFDGQFYEDVYVSYNNNGEWSAPENLGKPLNTSSHDAVISLSPDGQRLLLYNMGDVFICELKGDVWSKPEALPSGINTVKNETSACFSPDGRTIYLVRGKVNDPNKSNSDIYYSVKTKQGKWSTAKRMPTNINSPYDETGVFMHPDGKTLYFSSKGHATMGGFDIFKTILQENKTWSDPENLGYPVNSPDDDIFFVLSADGRNGYYSTVKADSKGFTDIYQLNFVASEKASILQVEDFLLYGSLNPISDIIIADPVFIKKIHLTILKGIVTDAVTGKKKEAKIQIIDNEINEVISELNSNQRNGKYLLTLPSGKNYAIVVSLDGYLTHSENFNIPSTSQYQEKELNVKLLTVEEGAKVILKNVFFETNKSNLVKESFAELERIKSLLQAYPNLRIQISGHTDNRGSADLNINLSEARAKAVVDYLVEKGISSDRLLALGLGSEQPIATNASQEGRAQNRRVELEVIK